MPGPCFRVSILDGELVALTKSTHATPMFTLTDSAFRPEILRSIAQVLWKCKLTKNVRRGGQVFWNTHLRKIVRASHLESALTILLDFKRDSALDARLW